MDKPIVYAGITAVVLIGGFIFYWTSSRTVSTSKEPQPVMETVSATLAPI